MSKGFESDSTYCSVFEKAKEKGKPKKLNKAKLTILLREITKQIQLHLEGKHLLGSQEVITAIKELSSIKTDICEIKCRMDKCKSVLNTIYKRNKAFENAASSSQNLIADCQISQDLDMLGKCKNSLKSGVLPQMDKSNSFLFETNMLTNQNFVSINQSSELIKADSTTHDKTTSKVISINNDPSDISTKQNLVNSIRFQNSELNDSPFQELKDSTLNVNKGTINECHSKTITQMENPISSLLDTSTYSNCTFVIEENNEKVSPLNLINSRIVSTPNYSELPGLLTNQNFTYTTGVQNSLLNEEQSLPFTRKLSQNINNSVKDYNTYNVKFDNYSVIDENNSQLTFFVPSKLKKNGRKSLTASNIKSKVNYYSNLFSQDLFNSTNTIIEPFQNTDTLITNNAVTGPDNTNNNAKSTSKITNSTTGKLCELFGKFSSNATLITNYSSLKGKNSADIFSEYMWTDDSQSQRLKDVSSISKDNSCQILIADSFSSQVDVDLSGSIKSSDYYSRQITSTSGFKDNFKKPSAAPKIIKKELPNIPVPKDPNIVTKETKSLLCKEKTIEENYDDLCQLMNKFLKIGDNSSPDINFLKNITIPKHKNDYKEFKELGSFLMKYYNQKMNTIIYNIGTGSVNWEDLSENIEKTSQMHQVISRLVAEILENINNEQQKISDEETFINQVSNCLDPEDIAKLDINNLIISNRLRICQIADNFKDLLLTENIEPYTKICKEDSEEELIQYDWRNI